MTLHWLIVSALLFLLAPAAMAEPTDCEPARCAVQAELDTECPCVEATNHGRHVSCVARVVNRLAKNGTIPNNCKGKIRRCAARSICGKEGFVTCLIPTEICDFTTGTGLCGGDPLLPCATDADCGTRCKIRRSADSCIAVGGTPGVASTCCSDCVIQ
jgi:hypothetical protein